ncbi:tripartite tricarboxylate transporter substrate-binding protein [Curvibacter sp. HBC28]|uniref:Tripartite tricarboxylate transporter substrate-binding protein n=1 Tax=Curvibacter microcysteis TaxID=3026419 RepID=A0ABT5MCR3_9BURK|nr:tripartite tricarboxylate transporter substrate-binding protein [Curvibacter sp. HBC28]MDD0814368.1 tripartite tricarboxylate transporter substrate-binding protein [Curvibacter sp. HBC28]
MLSVIFAPANTPAPVVAKIHQAINETLIQPELKAKLALQSIDTAPISQEEFAYTVKQDFTRWAELLKVLKVKVE